MNSKKQVQIESDFHKIIKYETGWFVDAFNQVLYNQLLRQSQRNDDLLFLEIHKKIKQTEEDALSFYDQINKEVGGDQQAAIEFAKLVFE